MVVPSIAALISPVEPCAGVTVNPSMAAVSTFSAVREVHSASTEAGVPGVSPSTASQ